MSSASPEPVFSIPFRYLWSTNFAGDLESDSQRPTGLARFVGDDKNGILRILSDGQSENFINSENAKLWPLVLFGVSGTGKTSLALTIISELSDAETSAQLRDRPGPSPATKTNRTERKSGEGPIVLTALDFDRKFRSALETDSVVDFRRRLLCCGGLIIDDVQRLSEKPAAQAELLQLVDQMSIRARPLVFTMDCDPLLCRGLMPQLASRLSGGLSLPVHAPGELARDVIIRDLARIHRLTLTNDAVALLVNRLNVTVPKIVHFFNQVKATLRSNSIKGNSLQVNSNGAKKNLTVANDQPNLTTIDSAFIARMFERSESDLKKLAKIILQQVAAEYQIKLSLLRGKSRKQSIVLARAIAIYLNRKLLGTSFTKIGVLLGNRDHSTIMHANQKIENLIQKAKRPSVDQTTLTIRNQILQLEQSLSERFTSQISFASSPTTT